jgi:hypothetical protein
MVEWNLFEKLFYAVLMIQRCRAGCRLKSGVFPLAGLDFPLVKTDQDVKTGLK